MGGEAINLSTADRTVNIEYRDFEIQNDSQREQALRNFARSVESSSRSALRASLNRMRA